MKKITLLTTVITLALAGAALAGGGKCDPPGPECGDNTNVAIAGAAAVAGASASADVDVNNTNLNLNANKNVNVNKNSVSNRVNQDQQQQQDQSQGQDQDQDQSQVAESSVAGSGNSSNSYSNSYESVSIDKTQFDAINPTHVSVGEVSKPVPQLYIQGQTEEDGFTGERSNAIQAGVTIPLVFGGDVNSALGSETRRLEDRVRHAREKHQAEMATLCISLHKIMKETGASISPELWERCGSYEHFNSPGTMKILGPHDGDMDPKQYSPHSEEYHGHGH